MININLDKRLMELEATFPALPYEDLARFMEEIVPNVPDSVDYLFFATADTTPDILAHTDFPKYVASVDYALCRLEQGFENIQDTPQKSKEIAHAYFTLSRLRDSLVQRAWEIVGSNRVCGSSFRYTFMTGRGIKIFLEEKMREYLSQ